MFKWVDEALLDEIRMVDVKRVRLSEDINALKKQVTEHLEVQKKNFKKMEEEMVHKLNEKIDKELTIAKGNMEELGHVMAKSAMKTVGVVVVVVGVSLVWLWGRQ